MEKIIKAVQGICTRCNHCHRYSSYSQETIFCGALHDVRRVDTTLIRTNAAKTTDNGTFKPVYKCDKFQQR